VLTVYLSVIVTVIVVRRKYLRDVDRTHLSQLAFVYCLEALEQCIEKQQQQQQQQRGEPSSSNDDDAQLDRLMLAYQVRQYAAKAQTTHVNTANTLLVNSYCSYADVVVGWR